MYRTAWWLVVTLGVLFGAGCAARPSPFDVAETWDLSTCRVEQVSYRSGELRVTGWIVTPKRSGPFPLLVWNHGSNVDLGRQGFLGPSWQRLAGCLSDLSNGEWVVFLPEGRGYAGSEGPRLLDMKSPSEVIAYLQGRADDVNAGVALVEERPEMKKGCAVVMGISHGGVVSILAAGQRQYRAVIAQATGMSYRIPMLGVSEMDEAIRRSNAQILLQHAANDTLVPPEVSRTLAEHGKRHGADVTLQEYSGIPNSQGHAFFNLAPHIWNPDFARQRDQALTSCP